MTRKNYRAIGTLLRHDRLVQALLGAWLLSSAMLWLSEPWPQALAVTLIGPLSGAGWWHVRDWLHRRHER